MVARVPRYPEDGFVSAKNIEEIWNIPFSRVVKSPNFPTPIALGEKRLHKYWKYSDVKAFFDAWHEQSGNMERLSSANGQVLHGGEAA